jgi:hypothetical protein
MLRSRIMYSAILHILLSSCSAQSIQAVSEALERANQSLQESNARTSSVLRPSATKLMLFGGRNNAVFLGCLTCSEYDTSSTHNQNGEFGSQYSNTSIWNNFSEYGSRYSSYSACNSSASSPPVIVDDEGTFYANLSLNRSNQNIRANRASSVSGIYTWLEDEVC